LAADGPRFNIDGEAQKCDEVRKYVLNKIDWPCKVEVLFRDKNLGCGEAVSSAITWFFKNVQEGIILEDDCLPNNEFFLYCENLLEYYRKRTDIFVIGGNNFQRDRQWGKASYYFSAFSHIWGWATWARAWEQYDFKLSSIKETELNDILKYYFSTRSQKKYWKYIFRKIKAKDIDTWDYQLLFTIWKNRSLAIVPNVNLVSNIGFGNNSTHTSNSKDIASNIESSGISPIVHPAEIALCNKADNYYYKTFLQSSLFQKIKNKIKSLTTKIF